MADPTIELLRKQIENFVVPPYPSKEEQDRIMAGRRGQKDIDAGRQTIREKIDAHHRATEQLQNLVTKLKELESKEEEKEDVKKKEDELKRYKESPIGQAFGAANSGPAFLLGGGMAMYGANELDKVMSRRGPLLRNAGLRNRLANAMLRTIPFAAGVGGGVYKAQELQSQMDDPTLTPLERDMLGITSDMLYGGALGTGVQGTARAWSAPARTDAGDVDTPKETRTRAKPSPQPQPQPQPEPQQATPLQPKPGTKADIRAQLEARGIKVGSKAKKDELAQALANAIRNEGSRRVRGKKTPPAKTGLLLPLTGAALGASAAMDEAEAAGLDSTAEQIGTGLAGAGAGGAAGYGTSRLAEAMARQLPSVVTRGAGMVAAPLAAGSTALDVGNLVTQGMQRTPAEGTGGTMYGFEPDFTTQDYMVPNPDAPPVIPSTMDLVGQYLASGQPQQRGAVDAMRYAALRRAMMQP